MTEHQERREHGAKQHQQVTTHPPQYKVTHGPRPE